MLAGLGLIFLASLKKGGFPRLFYGAHTAAIAQELDGLVICFVQNLVLAVGF